MSPPLPPRFALVVWPDARDRSLPSCIRLDGLAAAIARGAIVIAVEFPYEPPVSSEETGEKDDHGRH